MYKSKNQNIRKKN